MSSLEVPALPEATWATRRRVPLVHAEPSGLSCVMLEQRPLQRGSKAWGPQPPASGSRDGALQHLTSLCKAHSSSL